MYTNRKHVHLETITTMSYAFQRAK